MWAVVPVKRFDLAKGRLADSLHADERRRLARAMLEDVLEALTNTAEVDRVLVVTREPEVATLATSAGADTIAETGEGLNAAVTTGADAAVAGEADVLLVVHGDLPLARSEDFSKLLAIHEAAPALTIAPDNVLDGSNCVAASPPDLIPFRFGAPRGGPRTRYRNPRPDLRRTRHGRRSTRRPRSRVRRKLQRPRSGLS